MTITTDTPRGNLVRNGGWLYIAGGPHDGVRVCRATPDGDAADMRLAWLLCVGRGLSCHTAAGIYDEDADELGPPYYIEIA